MIFTFQISWSRKNGSNGSHYDRMYTISIWIELKSPNLKLLNGHVYVLVIIWFYVKIYHNACFCGNCGILLFTQKLKNIIIQIERNRERHRQIETDRDSKRPKEKYRKQQTDGDRQRKTSFHNKFHPSLCLAVECRLSVTSWMFCTHESFSYTRRILNLASSKIFLQKSWRVLIQGL